MSSSMTDLNKEREEFESDLAEHLIERDSNGFILMMRFKTTGRNIS